MVLLHSGDDFWGCKCPESHGYHYGVFCVVQFFNCILEDDDKGFLQVVQRFAAILLELPPLLGNAMFGVCEHAFWDIEECAHIWCVGPLLRGQQSVFRTKYAVAGLSIQWMVIILDYFGSRNVF